MIEKFITLLNKYDKVTIITHRTPDGDTLGTGLGIYTILKKFGKQIEICNVDKKLPNRLDFLPHFAKIKNQIDFDNSLIITCDSGSIDLLGFDLSLREIVNIDHHKSNTNYGTLNIVDSRCASASMVAYNLLKNDFEITKEVATCFYVALITDTQHFVTLNVNQHVFEVASELISFGVNLEEINRNLTQRKSLSSLRVLSLSLDSLVLYEEATIASVLVTKDMFEKSGAGLNDIVGIIDYAIGLSTVQIAILVMELPTGLKVSLRSTQSDITDLAVAFGGGGHKLAAGFITEKIERSLLLNQIIKEIKKRGLLNEL